MVDKRADAPASVSGPPAGGPPFGGAPAGGPPVGGPPMGGPPVGGPPNFGSFGGGLVPDSPMVDAPPAGIDQVAGVMNMPAFGEAFAKMTFDDSLEDRALWYVDIRAFRSINPKFGYMTGNAVLRCLADCIKELLCGDLPITRLGGDRFVFVTAGIDLPQCQETFLQLVSLVNEKMAGLGVNNRLKLVGGVYFLRETDLRQHDFRSALDYASVAHRNAQHGAQSSLVDFTEEDLERDMRRIVVEQSIDKALAEGQIEVWYQPQIDYIYGEVIGAEALARWNHPELGLISPVEFVPILENCGRIHDLDRFVWDRACRDAGTWRIMADGKPVPISINVSRAELFEKDLPQLFKRLQTKYGLPEGGLHLEITEGAFVDEPDQMYGVIEAMREQGLTVEMDDFGSGLSSLTMLKDVYVDVVKLDMGFVSSGIRGDRGGVVLSSVIRMLQGLDTPIIAEGVETLEQAEMLKNMGCRLMQGFHFSPPMPREEFESFVASYSVNEEARNRSEKSTYLEDLMSFDKESSFLFNGVIGGALFFFVREGASESILVNDRFYEDCGLDRGVFGTSKVNPLEHIDEESQATMWRAVAEARENGVAPCVIHVIQTGRWLDGMVRYIGESERGDIFTLLVNRAGDAEDAVHISSQVVQNIDWNLELLGKIAPSGFVKCKTIGDLEIEFISSELVEQTGLKRDQLMSRFHNSFFELVASSNRTMLMDAISDAAESGKLINIDLLLYHGQGGCVRTNLVGRIENDEQGESWLYAALMIVERVDKDDISLASDTGIDRTVPFDYYTDEDRLVIYTTLSDGSTKTTVVESVMNTLATMPDKVEPSSAAKAIATISDLRHHPVSGFTDLKCNLRGGAELRWYHVNFACDTNEENKAIVVHGYAHDANDEMGSAKWWRRQAEIDQLTGLLNRNSAEVEINLRMRAHGAGMMMMIDLDGFKRVNDELGHLAGDNLIRVVAEVLSKHFRDNDVLGRYGGDEFVAFVPLSEGANDPRALAERRAAELIEAVSNITISDGTHPGCSIGVAICNDPECSFYDLLEVADHAMYDSKMAGKGKCIVKEL